MRLDKWLWVARCFRTRSAATDACNGGRVKVNGESAKPAKPVRAGDRIEFKQGNLDRILEIVDLSERRGPAKIAQTLYNDHSPPPPPREVRPAPVTRLRGTGRPSKRERREIDKLRGRS